ncbi:CCA tRNA nucleotidyltransferase [Bacillus sp. FSL K6-3431]|uniref:CCA tRNA nucleotidyltransferase n=1 Tax=Bacillus sp. FSL K6-3431 TaxID=2921500 RepID=UPI0030FC7180
MNKYFLAALPVIQAIEEAGYEAYFVGGAVRDYILGRDVHDVDIATSATPEELKEIFSQTVDVGIEHGTILILFKGESFEVTTYRSESEYKDFRHPDSVTFIRSLFEDLQRRDFTMNAIAMDGTWNIVDPFDGKLALKANMIETVGKADNRFREDALRLMRAIRFVSQLGFDLEQNTEIAISKHANLLDRIAVERISAEMQKLLDGKDKRKALEIALKTRIYQYLPSIFNLKQVLLEGLSLPIEQLKETEMWLLFLYLTNADEPISLLKKWKLPAKKIQLLIRSLHMLEIRLKHDWTSYELYSAGENIACIVEKVYQTIHRKKCEHVALTLNAKFKRLSILSREQIVISGKDILDWTGRKGGPWMKELLIDLEKAILTSKVKNNKEDIKRWIETCLLP